MQIRSRIAIALVVAASLAACKRDADTAVAPPTGDYRVEAWVLPASAGSMSPDMSVAPDGRILLSWLNRQDGRRNALQFNSYTRDGIWQSQPRTIAVGNSLIANWADVPHMQVTLDGAMWVQWLQANAAEPDGYDAVLARSRDGGMTWAQMTRLNSEQGDGEHGFAALWPVGQDQLGVAWLDGGAMPASAGEAEHAHGSTQLRSNQFDMSLERGDDVVLDGSTCECCRTDVAMTDDGPLLVYRGRDDSEIRDIMATRHENGMWLAAKPVNADGWKTQACPVNGPAVAARGRAAVVGWYSEGGGEPVVRIARSGDAGDVFAAPVVVDKGAAVLGQVDVALEGRQAWVAWLREEATGQTLMLARYAPDLSRELQRIEVAKLQARGHASGTPKLVAVNDAVWLVWTDAVDGISQLQGARIAR